MKRILFILPLAALLSCGSNDSQITQDELVQNKTNQTDTPTQASLSPVSSSPKQADVHVSTGTVKKISAAEFKVLIFDYETNQTWNFAGDKPCVVDFYADWCGPCKMIAPRLEELAKEYEGKVDFYKVNTDENRALSGVFQIRGIPAILYCPASGQPQMSTGAFSKAEYKKIIEEFLLANN